MTTFTPTPRTHPFPHCIIDGYWDDDLLDAIAAEFPHPDDPRWQRFSNEHEVKLGGTPAMWGDATSRYMGILEGLAGQLGEAFGIPDLSMETVGGGMHLIPPGGHLDTHTDFNRSPDTGLFRRLNCLTFLNRGWRDEGGRLLLGDENPIGVVPELNRMVIFETSDRSWHGHPKPAQRWRLSVAAYFFSPEPPPGYRADQSTVWRG